MPIVVFINQQEQGIQLVGITGGTSADDIDIPAGTQIGDCVYFITSTNTSGDTSVPTGFTELVAPTGSTPCIHVCRRWYTTTPPAQVDGGAQSAGAFLCISLRGVSQSQPEDATTTTASGTSSSPNPPSITTVTSGCTILGLIAFNDSLGAISGSSGYDNYQQANGTDDTEAFAAIKQNASVGANDPGSWFVPIGDDWQACTIAVRPG